MDVFAPLAYAASPFGGEAQMWRCEIIYLASLMSTMSSVVWLWVQLIVTLPITGTMPWYPPRDTQSRGPSLLLTSVHVEQNVKS